MRRFARFIVRETNSQLNGIRNTHTEYNNLKQMMGIVNHMAHKSLRHIFEHSSKFKCKISRHLQVILCPWNPELGVL